MMDTILQLHSITRWLILISLVAALYVAYSGWLFNKKNEPWFNRLRIITQTIAHIQLVVGLYLYFTSPIVSFFWRNPSIAIKMREIRFFSMEHSLVMLVAIVLWTIVSMRVKRIKDDSKYKKMAIVYTIVLILILSSIPWSFSPLVSRPLWR